ncbi:MAG: isocitrate lyase/PEP mutase family protein [Sphaerochaetaceae bacterium]
MGKKTLREYMTGDKFYYVPEIYDCISTRAAEMNGFEMTMISSSDFACSLTGIPDLNLITIDEYCFMIERIKNMSDMPLFIDADEGFGRPLQTYLGCKRMAHAGADCILITDGNELSQPGLASIKDTCYRLKAAKDGMEGTDCLLLASCKANVDEDFDAYTERLNSYLEAGADMILPLGICNSTKYGGKFGAAKKIGEAVKAAYWYPDLDPGDKAEDAPELLKAGFLFTGIHYSFRAAMYAMLDTGRHVFESKTNDYVMEHYDYTGYHFHYSPMACFLNGTPWVEQEQRYVDNPDDAFAARKLKGFCGESDKLVWDGKPVKR